MFRVAALVGAAVGQRDVESEQRRRHAALRLLKQRVQLVGVDGRHSPPLPPPLDRGVRLARHAQRGADLDEWRRRCQRLDQLCDDNMTVISDLPIEVVLAGCSPGCPFSLAPCPFHIFQNEHPDLLLEPRPFQVTKQKYPFCPR